MAVGQRAGRESCGASQQVPLLPSERNQSADGKAEARDPAHGERTAGKEPPEVTAGVGAHSSPDARGLAGNLIQFSLLAENVFTFGCDDEAAWRSPEVARQTAFLPNCFAA